MFIVGLKVLGVNLQLIKIVKKKSLTLGNVCLLG